MQNQNSNVEGQYKLLAIIWLALLASQLMFLVIVFVVRPEAFRFDLSKSPLGENPLMTLMLAVLAISNFALSFVFKRKYLNQAIGEAKPALVQTAMILGVALCESISLFGMVLAFTFSYQYFFLWFALGIAGTILHFPKRDNLIAASFKR